MIPNCIINTCIGSKKTSSKTSQVYIFSEPYYVSCTTQYGAYPLRSISAITKFVILWRLDYVTLMDTTLDIFYEYTLAWVALECETLSETMSTWELWMTLKFVLTHLHRLPLPSCARHGTSTSVQDSPSCAM